MGVCVYTPTAFTILITTIYTHTTITSVCVCVFIYSAVPCKSIQTLRIFFKFCYIAALC